MRLGTPRVALKDIARNEEDTIDRIRRIEREALEKMRSFIVDPYRTRLYINAKKNQLTKKAVARFQEDLKLALERQALKRILFAETFVRKLYGPGVGPLNVEQELKIMRIVFALERHEKVDPEGIQPAQLPIYFSVVPVFLIIPLFSNTEIPFQANPVVNADMSLLGMIILISTFLNELNGMRISLSSLDMV